MRVSEINGVLFPVLDPKPKTRRQGFKKQQQQQQYRSHKSTTTQNHKRQPTKQKNAQKIGRCRSHRGRRGRRGCGDSLRTPQDASQNGTKRARAVSTAKQEKTHRRRKIDTEKTGILHRIDPNGDQKQLFPSEFLQAICLRFPCNLEVYVEMRK